MKFIHILCFAAALFMGQPFATAQTNGNTEYFLHTVAKGQSLYSIARMYNVSVDDIVRMNPGSDQKVRTGKALKIPQASGTNSHAPQYHTIQTGETLYQLTVKYGVTAQAICAANPGLSAENFRIGQVVIIPTSTGEPDTTTQASSAQPAGETKKDDWQTMHKVQRRETIFSISREYGITEEELIAANPELKKGKLKRGTFLFIPYPKQEVEAEKTPAPVIEPTNEELFSQSVTEKKPINTIKVALMLPFSKETAGSKREAQSRIVEFYEGFLIAADSLKRQNVSMDIYAYDTKGTKAGTTKILANGVMKDMDLIIGPVNPGSITSVADFAQQHNIRLIVPFAPKVDEVFNSPLLYQINTPQSYLYSEVYEHFIRPHFDMHLFGYPEWQTYTQDFLANFYELDTYFYSSFYTNNLFPAAVNFTHAYRHWYSKDMANIYPKYGMLGFDIGYYFLKGLSKYGNKLENNLNRLNVVPIQTGFKFERVNNWGGFINRKIFFVHVSQDYELIKLDFE